MSYTQRKIIEARSRIGCKHRRILWAGIWEWCRDCGKTGV